MEHAGYVLTGWIGTGVVLSGYALLVARRVRRARRMLRTDPAVQ